MCLIAFDFSPGSSRHLLLVANRDEFHARLARPLAWWSWPDGVLAGRDEQAGGTWLAVSRDGRWAGVTNYRDPQAVSGRRSRGELPVEFLRSGQEPEVFVRDVHARRGEYGPFNLLAGDPDQLWYCSTHADACAVEAGWHAISNGLLDAPWPKSRRIARTLSDVAGHDDVDLDLDQKGEDLFRLLRDARVAPDSELPDTGVGLVAERLLSPPFIVTPDYGTRCSTILSLGKDSRMIERQFDPQGAAIGEVRYSFHSPPASER